MTMSMSCRAEIRALWSSTSTGIFLTPGGRQLVSEVALCRTVTGAPLDMRASAMTELAQPLWPYIAIRLYGMVVS